MSCRGRQIKEWEKKKKKKKERKCKEQRGKNKSGDMSVDDYAIRIPLDSPMKELLRKRDALEHRYGRDK